MDPECRSVPEPSDASVSPEDSIRTILARHPRTASVFARFGLAECGGEQGPDEPLDFFARVHHVPLDELLTALREAIDQPASGAKTPPRRRKSERSSLGESGPSSLAVAPRHDPGAFVLVSIGVTLTLGAALGTLNLARLTGTWGVLPHGSVLAHAYAQIFGFVGLFVMGVGYHVVPRFTGTALATTSSRPTLALQTTGVLSLSLAYLLPSGWMAASLAIIGAIALVTASVVFASAILRTLRAAPRSPECFEPWLASGSVWLVVASCLAAGIAIGDHVSLVGNSSAWQHVLWPVGLFGFAGSWIFGVSRRILPTFLGLRARPDGRERQHWALYQLGVATWSLGAWPEHTPMVVASRAVGAVALIGAIVLFTRMLGLVGRSRGPGIDPHRGYERYVAAAWVWLAVALATGPLWTLSALSIGRYGSIVMLDFSRHALALGFVTQMIMGISVRILPVFTGHALWSGALRTAVFWLLNVSVALRGLQAIVAAGYWPAAWPWIALSGPPALIAACLFGVNIGMTLRTEPMGDARGTVGHDPADAIVADLIAIDGVLDLLVRAGFAPLANPIMRATFARSITLRQASQLRGIPLEPVIASLRPLLPRGPRTAHRGDPGSGHRRIIGLTPVTDGPPASESVPPDTTSR